MKWQGILQDIILIKYEIIEGEVNLKWPDAYLLLNIDVKNS